MLKQIKFLSLFIILLILSNCGSQQNNGITITIPASVDKLVKDMNFDEAKEANEYYKATGDNIYMEIQTGARMVTLGSTKDVDKEAIQRATLELARNYFKEGNLEKAKKYAADYQQQYPGSDDLQEASYISLKAHHLSTNDPYRDQKDTLKTIDLAKKFIAENKEDTKFKAEAEEILKESYKKIFESEIYTANCYLARYKYSNFEPSLKAAYKRLDYIKTKLPDKYKNEAEILKLEIALAEAENKTDLAAAKKEELFKKYPEDQSFFENVKKIAMRL